MGYTGLCMGGIECNSRWMHGIAEIAMPDFPLAQSFRSITCFWHAFHMKGVLVVLEEATFLGISYCL